MPATRERHLDLVEPHKPPRFAQPTSTAGLRPSQRRAAEHRRAVARKRTAEHWLRRLAGR